MTLDSFLPLCIDLPLCAAVIMSGRYNVPQTLEGDLVYAYPSLIGYVLLLLALLTAAIPLLPGAQGDMNPLVFDAVFWLFSLIGIGTALHIFRYRLIVGHNKLVISVFLKEEIEFSRITDVQYERVGKNHRLAIRLTNGRCIAVSGFMRGLPSLAKLLGDRMSASGRGATSL